MDIPDTPVLTCPTCQATDRQTKSGSNDSGSPRRHCQHCGRTYTPKPKHKGYETEKRQMALRMYVDGINFRRIARLIGVHHQTVINWVDAAAARLPSPPTPKQRQQQPVDTLELDEIHTFVGQKKRPPTS
jgi:transposase-like protein